TEPALAPPVTPDPEKPEATAMIAPTPAAANAVHAVPSARVRVAPTAPPVEPVAPIPTVVTKRALGDQVVSLGRAQGALAPGHAAEAVRLVDEYEAHFPGGSLLQEASVVRIEALLMQGKKDEAKKLGAQFFAAHPTSPYAAKLRRLLETGSNE